MGFSIINHPFGLAPFMETSISFGDFHGFPSCSVVQWPRFNSMSSTNPAAAAREFCFAKEFEMLEMFRCTSKTC